MTFEALPIEVMAERGRQTMQFGPLKPVVPRVRTAPDLCRRAAQNRKCPPLLLQHGRIPNPG